MRTHSPYARWWYGFCSNLKRTHYATKFTIKTRPNMSQKNPLIPSCSLFTQPLQSAAAELLGKIWDLLAELDFHLLPPALSLILSWIMIIQSLKHRAKSLKYPSSPPLMIPPLRLFQLQYISHPPTGEQMKLLWEYSQHTGLTWSETSSRRFLLSIQKPIIGKDSFSGRFVFLFFPLIPAFST